MGKKTVAELLVDTLVSRGVSRIYRRRLAKRDHRLHPATGPASMAAKTNLWR
jgi:hypothetical protein